MIHIFKFRKDPKCIFCDRPINFSDYVDVCKYHGPTFWEIPAWLRFVLPKWIIKKWVLTHGKQPPPLVTVYFDEFTKYL